jgi:hypothetical protein
MGPDAFMRGGGAVRWEALCDGASVDGRYSFNGLVVERKVGSVTRG